MQISLVKVSDIGYGICQEHTVEKSTFFILAPLDPIRQNLRQP